MESCSSPAGNRTENIETGEKATITRSDGFLLVQTKIIQLEFIGCGEEIIPNRE